MTPLWSTSVGASLRGLSLARERGWLLTWDHDERLHLYERDGAGRGSCAAPGAIAAACLADDGSGLAGIGTAGDVWFLGPDLEPRWQKRLPHAGRSIACDPFGRFVAASDAKGNLYLLDNRGQRLREAQVPRALRHLAFVPERPHFIGAADFGLVMCFDDRLGCVWRDGLVANIGSLAVSEDGDTIALAGFTPGLYCYRLVGPPHRVLPLPSVCRLAALRHDGKRILTTGPANDLLLVDREGKVRDAYNLPTPALAIALAPLADWATVALADGTLLALELA